MIRASTDGKRILADIPWMDGRGPDMAKSIVGAKPKWDTSGARKRFLYWTYPLTLDTCHALRRAFGDDLMVMPPLSAWARREIARGEQLNLLRDGHESPNLGLVADLAPSLRTAMKNRPYQEVGAGFLDRSGQVILGDQPGLGKTLQTLAAILQHGCQTALVSCPRTATRTVWEKETARWAPTIRTFVAQGSRKQREDAMRHFATAGDWNGHPRMLITNTEMVRGKKTWICPDGTRWHIMPGRKKGCSFSHEHKREVEYEWPFLFSQNWDAIVFDESHQLLASTKNIQSKDITQSRLGAVHLRRRLAPNGLAIALSGTPFRSSLPKSWGTLNWLRPDVFTSYWRFAETHFEVKPDESGYGQVVSTEPKDPAAFALALRPYYLARDKATVAADLPPVVYAGTPPKDNPTGPNAIWLDMTGKQCEAYYEMARDAEAHLDSGRLMATGVLAEITRLRQFACSYGRLTDGRTVFAPDFPSNKYDWVLEFLREREGHAGKVVIASCFSKLVGLFSKALASDGYPNLTLTGATSDKDRARLVERFADPDDPYRVAIINMQAGGVAITLDQADDMILVDQPWTSDEEQQVVDRIHRVSRNHNVTVYRLLSEGTVDEWMASLTEQQKAILRAGTGSAFELAKDAVIRKS